MRRFFDLLCATIGLMVLSPLFCVIALAIILDDGEPIFYIHRRVGRDFQRFGLLKFRSMAPNAAKLGGALTVANDPRVTRVGRILRQYKLDELPQLLNVICGDLALVGARPEAPLYVDMFRSQYSEILRDRPGITDPASLAFRHEEEMLNAADSEEQYISEILPRKLELSLEYARRRTFSSDLRVLIRTSVAICWTPRNLPSSVRGQPPHIRARVK